MERTRDRDRAALPEPMRREFRLLGDILGDVIRGSAGPDLLGRRGAAAARVIDARGGGWEVGGTSPRRRRRGRGRDRHAGRVLERGAAEQVARAFAVYFHLANPGRGAPAHPQPA